MNLGLKQEEVQQFIRANEHQDIRLVSLQKSPFPTISSVELAQQIKGLQVAKNKFPNYYKTERILYPPSINLEQASSQITAQYKSKLISGKTIVDLTSGFGIDSYAFSQNFQNVISVERNEELAEIVRYNYTVLNAQNIQVVSSDFEAFWKLSSNENWDVIYIDPSRRKGSQRKYFLSDLEPDILQWINPFFQRTKTVMVKLSPLLDLKAVIEQVPTTRQIYLVAVKNEMKELLLICNNEVENQPTIHCVNLETAQVEFSFEWEAKNQMKIEFSPPLKYIYEPNSAILKSGAFHLIGQEFHLKKLHDNTHLYTSYIFVKTFPGRIFEVQEEVRDAKRKLPNQSFHVLTKNYPTSVEAIRKKYKLKESDAQSLIFTQSIFGKHILLCKKIQ